MNELRENLMREMKSRGWNSYDLARASKVPQSTIHRALSGEHSDPRSTTIKKLALGLGISESKLRGFDESLGQPELNEFSQPYSPSSKESQKLINIINECERALNDSGQMLTKDERLDYYFKALDYAGRDSFSNELVAQMLKEMIQKKVS